MLGTKGGIRKKRRLRDGVCTDGSSEGYDCRSTKVGDANIHSDISSSDSEIQYATTEVTKTILVRTVAVNLMLGPGAT